MAEGFVLSESSVERISTESATEVDWEKCICHHSSVSRKNKLVPVSDVSWSKLQSAGNVRQDDIFKSLEQFFQGPPRGYFHRVCYQLYTNKSHLDRIVNKRQSAEVADVEQRGESGLDDVDTVNIAQSGIATDSQHNAAGRLTRSSVSSTIIHECLFCQEDKSDPSNRRKSEDLTKCSTLEVGSTIANAARIRGHSRILLATEGQDVVAKELCYHRSCFSCFILRSELAKFEATRVEPCQVAQTTDGREAALEYIFEYVRTHILEQPKFVTTMSVLKKKYVARLVTEGAEITANSGSRLKVELLNKFNDELRFHRRRQRNLSELVYSHNIPVGPLLEICCCQVPRL